MRCQLLLLLGLMASSPAWAKKVDLHYQVRLLPASGQAEVRVTLAEGSAVRSLDFDLGKAGAYSGFQADGQWQLKGQRGIWQPAAGKTSLSYRVQLDQQLGQRIIIENRGGAGGTVGASAASKMAPDGYGFFVGAAHHAIAPALYPKLDYNILTDLVPLTVIANPPQILVVNPKRVAADDFKSFMTLLRANPGKLNYASAGNGSGQHVIAAALWHQAGVELLHDFRNNPELRHRHLLRRRRSPRWMSAMKWCVPNGTYFGEIPNSTTSASRPNSQLVDRASHGSVCQ